MWFPYATETDIPAHVADEFEDLPSSLRDASYRVRSALKTAHFDIDADGRPTNEDVATAIKDATRAQLTFWSETGDDSGAGAQNGGGSILSVSFPGGGGSTNALTKQEAREAPAVDEILRSCPGITWGVGYR